MTYRVILTRNGEYKATLHKCVTRATSFLKFNQIKSENEEVMFEKRYVNYRGIKPVSYKIYIVKDREETDVSRKIKNKDGELVDEKPFGYDKWTILDSAPFNLEEEFLVFGYDNQRKQFKDIVKLLLTNINKEGMYKEIVVVHNKLLIYNEESFDMVICKCKKDAQRLHHTLYNGITHLKLKNLLFLGTCTKDTIGFLYDLIHERTGWDYIKIRRTTTRP